MASNLEVVVRLRDLTTQGLAKITASISKMGSQVLRWGAAFTGISGAFSIAGIAKFASELEDLQGRLSGVFEGDLKAAGDQLERIRAMAAEPIVGTDQLVDSFIKGATTIRGFSEETLATLSNVAITFDRDVGSVFNAWAATWEKSLRQMGIVLDKTGKQWSVNGQEVARNMDAVRAKIVEIWEQKFPNAVDLANQRFSGAMANFQDAIEDLLAEIGERILPKITGELNKLTQWVHDNEGEIVDFAEDAATAIGEFADQVVRLGTSIKDHEAQWRTLLIIGAGTAALFGKGKVQIAGGLLLLQQYLDLMDKYAPKQGKWGPAWNDDFVGPPAPLSGEDMAGLLGMPTGTGSSNLPPPPRFAPPPPAPLVEDAAEKVKKLKEIGLEVDGLRGKFGTLKIDIEAAFLAEPVTAFGDSMKRVFQNARPEIELTNQDLQDFANETIVGIKSAFTDDFAQGLADMMNGVQSFEDSWKGAVTSVLEGLQQIILKMILMAAYQRFVAPILGGIFGAATGAGVTGAVTAGALTAPASFRAGSQPVVIAPQIQFNAGFVDPSGAEEFFARNSSRFRDIATGAVTEAIDRSPAFRARVRR